MKQVLMLACTLVAAVASAQRGHGVVVAISDLPAQPQALRTSGAPADAFRLSAMVQRYGIKVDSKHRLVRTQATAKAVRDALAAVKAAVQPGESAVFAYSGLGTSLAGGRGGLAVFDSAAGTDNADLSMIELSRWATEIEAKGAKVWFLVDAAWSPLALASREFEDLAYRNVTKFFERPDRGAVADPVYQGPGVFLSATHATGAAYEWKINVTDNQFAGAFTTQLVNYTLRPLSEGKVPKFQDVLVQLASEFRQRSQQGYMPGQTIWTNLWSEPEPGVILGPNQLANQNFLGLSKAPGNLPPPTGPEKFRLGFEIDRSIEGEQERRTLREAVWPEFSAYVREKLPSVELVEDYAYKPDRVVRFFRKGNGLGAVLSGGPLEPGIKRFDEETSSGPTVAAVMDSEFADRGSRQKFKLSQVVRQMAAAQALFQLPDFASPSSANAITAILGSSFVNDQKWSIQLTSKEPGVAYIFTRADWNGLISLVLPQDAVFGDTALAPNQTTVLPKKTQDQFIAYEEASPATGRVQVRVIVTDQKVFPGGGKTGQAVTEGLEETLRQIQAGKCRWNSIETSYLHKR